MSHLFGSIFQTSYVVKDLDPLLDHFTRTLGIGPFFLLPLPVPFDWLEYRGRRTNEHDIFGAVALAYSGDMMIEVIVPGSAPSHYHEFLARGGEGVHHLGTLAVDYDQQLLAARNAGYTVLLEGCNPGVRFAYLETDTVFRGTLIEIMELGDDLTGLFAQVKSASIGWTGTDPVRRL